MAQLEEKLNKKEESCLPQLTERFDNINNELGDIKATFKDKIRFEFKVLPLQITCQHCRRQTFG